MRLINSANELFVLAEIFQFHANFVVLFSINFSPPSEFHLIVGNWNQYLLFHNLVSLVQTETVKDFNSYQFVELMEFIEKGRRRRFSNPSIT